MGFQTVLYVFSFGVIWYAAGIIVNSVDRIAHKLNLSSFSVSFFVLGMLTSIPEISVGISSLIDNKPEIFTGNLIGGIIIIFLLIIPLFAVLGNGIKFAHQMTKEQLIFTLLIISAPTLFVLDGVVVWIEGLAAIIVYCIMIYVIETKKGLLERLRDSLVRNSDKVDHDIVKLVIGVVIIFVISKFIVDTTIVFSNYFGTSTYLISLIVISLGTNLPELSLVFRSLALKKKEVALGDYMGSAAANTVIFGALTLVRGSSFQIQNHFLQTFLFVFGGLALFYFFFRSKQDISRKEGLVLLIVYLAFLLVELR